jgi:hypothetical protein
MRAQEFVLQKIRFGSRECFQKHAEHEHAAVNAVTPPGQFRAWRIERHQDPDAEPEHPGHDYDLAKQKKAVESFRPLRNHVISLRRR